MPLVPIVIERSGREERAMDIYSRLLQDRIIILGSTIDDNVANLVVAQMLVLAHQDAKADIHLYINSPGGSVTAGLAIYDTMQWVPCDVATYCIGQCASMGSLLLAAGAKGKRNALPHGRIMIHQPLAGMEGTATDILIHAEEFIRMKKQLNQIYQKHSGQTLERLQDDTDRDRFMSPEEARDYGLIDQVVDREPAIPLNPNAIPVRECASIAPSASRASSSTMVSFASGKRRAASSRAGIQQKPVSAAGSAAWLGGNAVVKMEFHQAMGIRWSVMHLRRPTTTLRPVSSRHSRSTASTGSSPGSHLPPGNSQ